LFLANNFVFLLIKKAVEISPKSLNIEVFDPEKARFIASNEGIEKAMEYFQNIILTKDDIIAGKDLSIVEKDLAIVEKDLTIVEKEALLTEKEALIAKFVRMLFGQKAEKYIHQPIEQLKLDFGGEMTSEEIKAIEEIINKKRVEAKKKENIEPKSSKRIAFPVHLEVIETIIQPKGDLSEMVFVKNESSDFLEYQPSKHFIHRIIRPVYAPKIKEGSFAVATVPDSVFEKSKVGVGIVAHLLYGKFVMHLPIDRMLKEMIRQKIPTNSATIYNWVKLGINRLEILYDYQFNKIITQKYLQVDETTLKVLESEAATNRKKGSCHLGYFWVYNNPITGSAVFKYQQGRGAKYPEAVLKNFIGYLQTDGYSGYVNLAKSENIIHLACWAHARRKFEEALPNDKIKAEIAMKLIQELYDIERQAKDAKLDADQRKALRIEKSLPVYNLIGKWISQNLKKTLPKSAIGKAMQYTFDRWDELGNYMLDGLLEIDNNLVENVIRPVAIGRKNYLFAGTHESAQRNAIMYTFMSDCKKHNVNPEAWLNYVLEKIPSASILELENLLPQNFNLRDGGN
jgi:transposase